MLYLFYNIKTKKMTPQITTITATIFGMLSVIFGAFGAHALEPVLLENNRLGTFDTANQYHFFHALALLMVGLIDPPKSLQRLAMFASFSLFWGVMIFSGSLYFLSLTDVTWLGAITPIGGVFFLFGWGLLIRLGLLWPSED